MKKELRRLLGTLLFLHYLSPAFAQNLNGSYTIGASMGADYTTITSAINDLKTATISGDITYNIETATYHETMDLSSIGNGNFTITFSGTNKETTFIHPLDSIVVDLSGISIRNTNNIILKNFTLVMDDISDTKVNYDENGTKGIGVFNASNISLDNLALSNAHFVAGNNAGEFIASAVSLESVQNVTISSSEISGAGLLIYTQDFQDVTIENCEFQSGQFHIYNLQNQNTSAEGMIIRENTFTGPFPTGRSASAIFMWGHSPNFLSPSFSSGLVIENNSIDAKIANSGDQSYGMYISTQVSAVVRNNIIQDGCYGALFKGASPLLFESNEIYETANEGVHLNLNSASNLINNIITSSYRPIALYFTSNTRIAHNTLIGTGNQNCLFGTGGLSGDSLVVVNNIFSVTNASPYEVTLFDITATNVNIDHNLYSGNANTNTFFGAFGKQNPTIYQAVTLSDWQNMQSDYDQNSQSFTPTFVGVDNYHINSSTDYRFGTFLTSSATDLEGHIRDMANGVDVGADQFCDPCNIIWTGSWSNITGPSDTDEVAIIDDYSFSIDGLFMCDKLVVSNGSEIIIDNSSLLDVKGDIINNGTIEVQSGSTFLTYDGSTFSGNDIEVKRNTRYADGKYSMVGSPVEQDASITGGILGQHVYLYDETESFNLGTQGLEKWVPASAEVLTPGRGYTQANQQEIVFEGKPNTGTITYSGSYTPDDGTHEGFNLVSNPYTAAIDVADFLTTNTNIAGAIYLWDDNGSDTQRGTDADYIVANGIAATNSTPGGGQGRYNTSLGTAQGFFVKLNGAANTDISFTEAMRLNGNNADGNFFRRATMPIVRINLTNEEGLFKQTVIGWREDGSSTEIIRAYDAPVFDSSSEHLIYSLKAGKALAIQAQPYEWNEIPLGVNVASTGAYSIEMEGTEPVFLMDNATGEVVNLTDESYDFEMTESGSIVGRFTLLSAPARILNIEETKVDVFAYGKSIYIFQETVKTQKIEVYDLNGQLRLSENVTGKSVIDASRLPIGIYIATDGINAYKILLK